MSRRRWGRIRTSSGGRSCATRACSRCSTRPRRSAAGAGRCPPAPRRAIALHSEYKSRGAALVEIDCRPATVQRQVENGYTGPRVTKVVYAVDVGLPINPLGLEAQMMGGIMDGIAQALSYSLHLDHGHFLEGSWDNAYYTRQWNVPRGPGRRHAARRARTRVVRASSVWRRRWPPSPAPTRGRRARRRRRSRSTTTCRSRSHRCRPSHRSPHRRPTVSQKAY